MVLLRMNLRRRRPVAVAALNNYYSCCCCCCGRTTKVSSIPGYVPLTFWVNDTELGRGRRPPCGVVIRILYSCKWWIPSNRQCRYNSVMITCQPVVLVLLFCCCCGGGWSMVLAMVVVSDPIHHNTSPTLRPEAILYSVTTSFVPWNTATTWTTTTIPPPRWEESFPWECSIWDSRRQRPRHQNASRESSWRLGCTTWRSMIRTMFGECACIREPPRW